MEYRKQMWAILLGAGLGLFALGGGMLPLKQIPFAAGLLSAGFFVILVDIGWVAFEWWRSSHKPKGLGPPRAKVR